MELLASLYGGGQAMRANLRLVGRQALEEAPISEKYELLRGLYHQNGVYQTTAQALHDAGIWLPSIKALGNPTNECVEFYAQNLLVGELELESENEAILEHIDRFWRWSNFDAQKLVLSREFPMLGDSFVQVTMRPDKSRVYMQLVDPSHVIDYDVDERGYIIWVRIEVPRVRRLTNGKTEQYTHIEIWSKDEQRYRRWEYTENQPRLATVDDDIARLGTPVEDLPLSAFGIDWVPLVHIPFRRVPGEARGQAAVWPSIEKIVELDIIVTSLHQSCFAYDRPTWAIESDGLDSLGRPVPAPTIAGVSSDASGGDTITMGRDKLFRLPSGWHLKSTVPDINFEAELSIVQDFRAMLERERPELLYGRLADLGEQTSGRALKFMLTKAIKAAEEARANVEQGLVRVNQMALSMMQVAGLVDKSIGDFGASEPGKNFDHRFKERPILPIDELDEAQTDGAQATAYKTWVEAGLPIGAALQRSPGYTEEQATDLLAAQADAVERGAEQ